MLKNHLRLLMSKPGLTQDEEETTMTIMLDAADPHQIAALGPLVI